MYTVEYKTIDLSHYDKSQIEILNEVGKDGWILSERYVFAEENKGLMYRIVF